MIIKNMFMRLIILLLISSVCFGQKDDSSKVKKVIPISIQANDSTALLSFKDVQNLAKYLEDKLLARDYNVVMNAISQLINERAKEYQKPKK